MSMTNKDDFNQAFEHFADMFEIPKGERSKMKKILFTHINEKRTAIKSLLDELGNQWNNAKLQEILIKRGERSPYAKEQLGLFSSKVISLSYTNRMFRDAHLMPYQKIERGSSNIECPIHTQYHGDVFEVDSDFWRVHPVGQHVDCYCSVRTISKSEYNN
ncbi:hypothetical protein [Vibrio gazogenes]|uniref:Phage Mu protein F like protein n=1 Tax=Vibrio gazogenes DSM 21264 = NBRC 103151 TaxID=1123492 RepID=A0A1M5F8J1_VIBGA|nr:hypothetical protein [Vibrio gazogenes]USP15451.1 phage head morphogenesis protein [Vibrio gazogenes]SHF87796.1 hypothetical protein SAMN02745781_03390 [Vibrio gazogenes DSM 21264] [Vibrio gazogenes DSM 21264 = NBRC 103151]SJN54520.1 hypothetical protein BQ6471_01053 [Vibrio gazogenes]